MKRNPLIASRGLIAQVWADDCGAVLSIELILFLTILVIGLVPGYIALRQGTLTELLDLSNSIMALNTSYSFSGQQLVCDRHEQVETRENLETRENPDAYGFKPVHDRSNPRNATTTHNDDWQHRNRQAWTGGSSAVRTTTPSMQNQGVEASNKVSVSESNNRPAPID
jgi:hypothetical protein